MTENRADVYDELVQEFYGINPGTFKVDNVAITRSGKLWQWTDRGYQIHRLRGSNVLAEILALTLNRLDRVGRFASENAK